MNIGEHGKVKNQTRERIKIFQWVGKIEAIVMSRHIRHVFQKTNVVQKNEHSMICCIQNR